MLHLQLRFLYIKTVNRDIEDLILTSRGIYATASILHYINCENTVLYRNCYSNIQNTPETCIRCFIGIISRILADSYPVNKRKYGLHVFIEPLYNKCRKVTQKLYRKILFCIQLYSVRICKNAVQEKPVFTVVLSSVNQYLVIKLNNTFFLEGFLMKYNELVIEAQLLHFAVCCKCHVLDFFKIYLHKISISILLFGKDRNKIKSARFEQND